MKSNEWNKIFGIITNKTADNLQKVVDEIRNKNHVLKKWLVDNMFELAQEKRLSSMLIEIFDPKGMGYPLDFGMDNFMPYWEMVVRWFAIRHDMKYDKAEDTLLSNIRFMVGHYSRDDMEAWRTWVSKMRNDK